MLNILYMEVSPLSLKDNFEHAYGYVDSRRKEKVDAARQEKDKLLSLAAGLLISYAVLQHLKHGFKMGSAVRQIDLNELLYILGQEQNFWWEASIKLKETPNGKPYLADHPELFFNLSHSGDYTVLALSDRDVGVDIQKWRPVTDSFYKRLFHEMEICDHSEEQIFSVWTAKEAFVKCTGEGLSKDFRQLKADIENLFVTDIITGARFRLVRIPFESGYSLSVCENG